MIVYSENFAAYAVNTPLTNNPPNYDVTNSSGLWNVQNALNFGGKAAQNSTSAGWYHAKYLGANFGYTDLTVKGDMNTRWAIFARVSTLGVQSIPTDGYQVLVQNLGVAQVYLFRGGYAVVLGTVNMAPANPHNFLCRLLCVGNQISVYIDGVLVLGPVTDNSYANGAVGIGALTDTLAQWSNISVDDGTSPISEMRRRGRS